MRGLRNFVLFHSHPLQFLSSLYPIHQGQNEVVNDQQIKLFSLCLWPQKQQWPTGFFCGCGGFNVKLAIMLSAFMSKRLSL